MSDKGIWKTLAILVVFVMVGNSVAMPYSDLEYGVDKLSYSGERIRSNPPLDLEYGIDKLSPSGERIRLKPPYVFSTDDIQAICWLEDESFFEGECTYLELPDAYKEMVFTFKWYDPYGNIEGVLPSDARPIERVAGWCSGMYCECGMYISGYAPASKLGEWRVKVYRNDDYLFTKSFSISRHQTPTPTPTPTLTATPTPTPTPAPYYVNPGESIQVAVDSANAGDTIIVREGTYIENIRVDKRLTILSENGPELTIVRAEDSDDHVFNVSADYVNISGFKVEGVTRWFSAGISLYYAGNCNISNNNCSINRFAGISLDESNNNYISNNNCSNNNYGIYLWNSNHNSMLNNDCSNNSDGIFLWYSNYNSISNNDCSNNGYAGIFLLDSNANKLTGNALLENGIVIWGYLSSHYEHEIDESNIVNEKPVYYWKNIEGGRVPDGAGQIMLVNCKNVVVENQNLNNASVGIRIVYSSDITIKNNGCSNNSDGILLDKSNGNCISNNNCSNNGAGISLDESNNNCISNNNCSSNNWAGIRLWASNSNKLADNILLENGIVTRGYSLSHYEQEIDGSNTVNGKPIYYWKSIEGGRIPDGATQVILVNCKNVVVENQNLSNASVGIQTAFSSYITIKNNTCSNNDEGIYLSYSTNNSISNNNCSSNNWAGISLENSNHSSISNNNCSNNLHGIYLADSTNNHIYLNNFINNGDNFYSYVSTNIWNSPSKMTYAYNETTYTSYLGNYWDDYEGTDADGDGIGDTSYSIYADGYPLMEPWENYFA